MAQSSSSPWQPGTVNHRIGIVKHPVAQHRVGEISTARHHMSQPDNTQKQPRLSVIGTTSGGSDLHIPAHIQCIMGFDAEMAKTHGWGVAARKQSGPAVLWRESNFKLLDKVVIHMAEVEGVWVMLGAVREGFGNLRIATLQFSQVPTHTLEEWCQKQGVHCSACFLFRSKLRSSNHFLSDVRAFNLGVVSNGKVPPWFVQWNSWPKASLLISPLNRLNAILSLPSPLDPR